MMTSSRVNPGWRAAGGGGGGLGTGERRSRRATRSCAPGIRGFARRTASSPGQACFPQPPTPSPPPPPTAPPPPPPASPSPTAHPPRNSTPPSPPPHPSPAQQSGAVGTRVVCRFVLGGGRYI